MITSVIAAATRDALALADGGAFFEETEAARGARAQRTLHKSYPESLRTYLATVSAQHFAQDMESILPLLSSGSVMSYGRTAAKHRFLKACAEAIKEAWVSEDWTKGKVEHETYLGEVLSGIMQERGTSRHARVTERELQQFVELVLHEDSPQVQIADELESLPYEQFQKLYGGIPAFQVRRQLLGGSRLFVKGKLVDASWRAKVQSFLSALK